MELLKILGLKKDKTIEQPKPPKKEEKVAGKNPHDSGGCCGGCGSK